MSVENYNEVVANLTWLQLNSEYNDPIYKSTLKLQQDLFRKLNPPPPSTNYFQYDQFVINTRNVTLQYGSYQCSAAGKEAYMDSFFSCLLFQIPFFLEKIQLGYIGFVFVLPIMLISIFGGIKESYRWFILNQAIWDAFLCYDFICARPTLFGWSTTKNYLNETTCFYRDVGPIQNGPIPYYIFVGFRLFLRHASFIPVFQLALSRFVCMYFPSVYKRFTKNGFKILIFVAIFNLICLAIFTFTSAMSGLAAFIIAQESQKCDAFCSTPSNITYCYQNFAKHFQCYNRVTLDSTATLKTYDNLSKIFKYILFFIPPTMFFLSIICAAFLFFKIASQLKFQLQQNNQESFKQTIKISSIVGFQCATMSLIFVMTGIQKFMQIKGEAVGTYKIYDDLSPFLFLLQYYTTTTSLNMIRILLDSSIILCVLTGYSKCVVSTFKFFWMCFSKPKQAFKNIKFGIRGTEITILSDARK